MLARRADAVVGKRRLLEDYLNLAEWGPHRQRGIAYAARACFGKAPAALDAREGALLAWLLPDPKHRCLWVQRGELPKPARRRIAAVLERLESEGALPAGQAALLAAQPYAFEHHRKADAPSALEDDTQGDDDP
jgi:membrane peptidoglycan carboxypeptidase